MAWRVSVGAKVEVYFREELRCELSGKSALVVAMAALNGMVERRWLAVALWPDTGEGQARNNLRTLMYRVNRRVGFEVLIGSEHLKIDETCVRVSRQDNDALVTELDQCGVGTSGLLARAGITLDATSVLGQWLESARQRFRRVQLESLCEELGKAMPFMAADRMKAERAVALARACVLLEPLGERWHRQLMQVLLTKGDRSAALAAYEACKSQLMDRLGVQPDLQTRIVHLRVLQGQARAVPDLVNVTAELSSLEVSAQFPLVERETALNDIRDAVSRGQHVALEGEAGVGKTRLLRDLGTSCGLEKVSIRSSTGEEPYAAIAQLIQELQPRRAPLIEVSEQIELARLAPLAFSDVAPSSGRLTTARLHAALRHWGYRLREAGVRCLVLDDVHHADRASQTAISHLVSAREDGRPSLPLVISFRSGELEPDLSQALLDARIARCARLVAVSRLTLEGVRTLLESVDTSHGQEAPLARAGEVFKLTGGNPLFVIELALHTPDAEGESLPSRASLAALLHSRLRRCSDEAQQLACVAAIAPDEFSVELASHVTGMSILALMHPWAELQQRGLFADHGMAHDLVRDAVLEDMPGAIRRSLHRRVAAHAEESGMKGGRILHHWMSGQDFDRALPHALHQIHSRNAAGLSTKTLDLTLIDILTHVSDRVLLENLWVSAELRGHPQTDASPPEVWPRMASLVRRVQQLKCEPETEAWTAFELSRIQFFHDRKVKDAYATLSAAVELLPSPGIERARAELMLVLYSFALHGGPSVHVLNAVAALRELPEKAEERRLRGAIDSMHAVFVDPRDSIRRFAARLRDGRRRGDRGGVADAQARIAEIHLMLGNHGRAHRHFEQVQRCRSPGGDAFESNSSPMLAGLAALSSGIYSTAQALFEAVKESTNDLDIYRALLFFRLGHWTDAEALLAAATRSVTLNRQAPTFHFAAFMQAELDTRSGRDPLPALERAVATMRDEGIGGAKLELMSWEVLCRFGSSADRVAQGQRLIDMLKSQSQSRRWLPVMLDVAEAHSQRGSAAAIELAMEVAHALRRGYAAIPTYVPQALCRCASLLVDAYPADANSLIELARRWVTRALPHVPEDSRGTFSNEIEVNRRLLSCRQSCNDESA